MGISKWPSNSPRTRTAVSFHVWQESDGPNRHAAFGYLTRNIEEFFLHNGQWLPNPLERTLITTGVLALVHHSRARGGIELPAPQSLAEVKYHLR